MPKWLKILSAPIMIPYFIFEALYELLTSRRDPDFDILIDLTPAHQVMWRKMPEEQKKQLRAEIALAKAKQAREKREHDKVFYPGTVRLRDPEHRKEARAMLSGLLGKPLDGDDDE